MYVIWVEKFRWLTLRENKIKNRERRVTRLSSLCRCIFGLFVFLFFVFLAFLFTYLKPSLGVGLLENVGGFSAAIYIGEEARLEEGEELSISKWVWALLALPAMLSLVSTTLDQITG